MPLLLFLLLLQFTVLLRYCPEKGYTWKIALYPYRKLVISPRNPKGLLLIPLPWDELLETKIS